MSAAKHKLPKLSNNRHEAFAQHLATGMSATEAYEKAGYTPSQPNSARLTSNDMVQSRVAELQNRGAERVVVTLESLTKELEDARDLAIKNKQPSAAVSAIMGKARLFGFIGKDGPAVIVNNNNLTINEGDTTIVNQVRSDLTEIFAEEYGQIEAAKEPQRRH